jgi:RDD family
MGETGPQGLRVASLGRRVCAGLIDTVVFLPPIVAGCIGGGWLYVRYRQRRGLELDEVRPFTIPTRWNVVIWCVSGVARVQIRNWRTPGYRALGLRRVEVRGGGPLSAGNVLTEQCVAIASGQLRRRLMKPWLSGRKHRLEALQPELAEVRRAHADDPEAEGRALKEFYKRNRVNATGSCAPPLLGAAVMYAPALWSPLNQTIPERLAGIVVIFQR